jgi:integrase
LPAFGTWPLGAISRGDLRAFVARLRLRTPALTPKTIKNVVGLLSALLEYAAGDYELIAANPLRGMLVRSRRLVPDDLPKPKRVLEPEQFRDAVDRLPPRVARMAVVAALAGGLQWGELIAIRLPKDVDYKRNVIHVTRQLQRKSAAAPKTRSGAREVDMTPLVRKVLKATPRDSGLVFSPDGTSALDQGRWIKRQWRKAHVSAGIPRPIRWHDLRHQCASLLIAAGKAPLYIAKQLGHADPGFTLKTYGHLFETVKRTPVEWIDDLVWPTGCHASVTLRAATTRTEAGEHAFA